MLRVSALTVRTRLDAISLTARAGEILAVLGPNGAGKTTLLEAMSGLIEATSTIAWKDQPLVTFADRARTFAFMPDEAKLPEELDVRGVLAGVSKSSHNAMLASLGLEPLLDRCAGTLSRGEAKRVWLASTLTEDRPVMLLDEPFGAFDPLQLDDVLEGVREKARSGAAVIATIHQMTTAEKVADRILLLANGRAIAEGTLAELRAKAKRPDDAPLESVFRELVKDTDAVAT